MAVCVGAVVVVPDLSGYECGHLLVQWNLTYILQLSVHIYCCFTWSHRVHITETSAGPIGSI